MNFTGIEASTALLKKSSKKLFYTGPAALAADYHRSISGLAGCMLLLLPVVAMGETDKEQKLQAALATALGALRVETEAFDCGIQDENWVNAASRLAYHDQEVALQKLWPGNDDESIGELSNASLVTSEEIFQARNSPAPTPSGCLNLAPSSDLADADAVVSAFQDSALDQ